MVFAARIFGLMLILPVLALYADSYLGNSKFLLGICIGSYGLAQALLQIPIGRLSDKIGRKHTILLGLGLFILGSLVACYASSIYELILGRVIQGSGAIGSTMLAAVSDCSGVEDRTKAMAFIGITIGASFFLSVLLGPLIAASFGIKGILNLTVALSIMAFFCAACMLPCEKVFRSKSGNARECFNKDLCAMYFSIWVLHLCYTAIFGVVPLMLRNSFGVGIGEHGKFYFVSLVLSLVLSLPAIYFTERKNIMRVLFVASIFTLVISSLGFGYNNSSIYLLYGSMMMFFAAFTFLESLLPSLTSRYAAINTRGMVMGLFSSFQFFGIFTGGVLIGFIQHFFSVHEIFYVMSLLLIVWLVLCSKLRKPTFITKNYITVSGKGDKVLAEISNVRGVGEAKLLAGGKQILVKVDELVCDMKALNKIFAAYHYNIMH